MDLIERLRSVVAMVHREHAPDPRTSVYDVAVMLDGGIVRLTGAISEPAAIEALRGRLAGIEGSISDEIERLPEGLAGPPHAIVSAALAPVLAGPMVSEANISQAVLGQHFTVLRERGRWIQVRVDDGYVGWVHRGYVHRLDETEARAWMLGGEHEPYLSLGAELRGENGYMLARLPWGARFISDGVRGWLPNGASGTVVGEVVAAVRRSEVFKTNGSAIVNTALGWTGAPYIWGGITPTGVDCSGLVQAVYRMHGVELPRDSDQQAQAGEALVVPQDLRGFIAGDLLFFAEEPDRVSHVAISMGGTRIIHSALGNGGVRTDDLDGDSPFESELRRLLVSACRVIPG